ncbi:MAG: hypothetical protein L0027_17135 [Candidatus Rokubacteria bacterium]|nr:hypothetical protein [Candidatus Rokubacteria bacterium]
MSLQPDEQPFTPSHLESTAYRKRLLRKLNTLIAVLEVACAKVRRSLQGPEPDVERLTRIHRNLKDTLDVCQKAKNALQRQEKLPANLPPILGLEGGAEHLGASPAPPVFLSPAEAERFAELSPITADEIRAVDLDDLCNRLLFG